MIKIKESNKSIITLGIILIIIGSFLLTLKYIYYHYQNKQDEKMVETFFEKHEETTLPEESQENVEEEKQEEIINYNYIAVLEIPSISLKRGLVDKHSIYNDVNRNIEILQESDMPDVENGNLILASHSGSSNVSFFRNLRNVNMSDLINIFYNNVKYVYEVTNIYEEDKDGDISIQRDKKTTTLTLTTCKGSEKQLVVIATLKDKESY